MNDARTALRSGAAGLAPISLPEVLAAAELQSRVDRKYLVSPTELTELLDASDRLQVLEIDGLRDFRYESVYFDTPDLMAYHLAATRRRHRFKVRTRTYVDSGDCVLEVKTPGGRGQTVKERMPYRLEDREQLDAPATAFVAERIGPAYDVAALSPVLRTDYTRLTLVDAAAGTRVTCDAGLVCATPDGRAASMEHQVLVEVKSIGSATAVDRVLWSMACRPVSISKYCVGLAAVHPDLPANRWNRTLRRHFDWQPLHSPVPSTDQVVDGVDTGEVADALPTPEPPLAPGVNGVMPAW